MHHNHMLNYMQILYVGYLNIANWFCRNLLLKSLKMTN